MLECVVNVSEGRDQAVIGAIASAAGACLLDVHTDEHHNRTVLTLAGDDEAVEQATRNVAHEGVARINLRTHAGVHPRLGAVDVVPFVPLESTPFEVAIAARDRFATWAAQTLAVPCFLYGPERTLPEVRRSAFTTLPPEAGPSGPHPTAGAICVGARPVLVAYNLWLLTVPLEVARQLAAQLRGPAVRALGLEVGGRTQVSINLVDPQTVGPAQVYDAVASHVAIERAELVGLVPEAVLSAIPEERWPVLDLAPDRTIEARIRPRPRSPDGEPAPADAEGGGVPAR